MTRESPYTEDLADFGARERKMLAEILALELPENFADCGVRPAMNKNSGYVFLVNEDCQCAMINGETGKLEIFHSTPYNGTEGFLSSLLANMSPDDFSRDDQEYIIDNAEHERLELPGQWQAVKDAGL